MKTAAELTAEIEKYRRQIASLEHQIANAPDDVFGRMSASDDRATIADCADRIARLERRIAGTPEPGAVTMAQVRLIEYVNSRAYDNE